jgi:hypothetical protein
MKTHVDNVHPHLLTKNKIVLTERVVVKLSKTNHRQHGKRRVGATSFAITFFFGSINTYKNSDESQQRFIEDLVLYKAMCLFQCLKISS